MTADVVATTAAAERLSREPLIILEPLEAFLDAAGLGAGPLAAQPLGDGHSNVTYRIDRGDEQFVLRRPPRGPLPPSAHDVLRESRLLAALAEAGVRVPAILACCDDATVIGAPFYVMPLIAGDVLVERLPSAYGHPADPSRIAEQLVDALVELHAVDVSMHGLSAFGRGAGYLERQLRRFSGLLAENATRPLPDLDRVAEWLEEHRPANAETTVVHGDYRLGNTLFQVNPRPRLAAVLDWEMATIGDPLADVGYMTATWAQADDHADPMLDLSAVTRREAFPGRRWLAERYAERAGRSIGELGWYQVLALWKAAIFLESSFKRYQAGSTDDPYFARLGTGVPLLARRALRLANGL